MLPGLRPRCGRRSCAPWLPLLLAALLAGCDRSGASPALPQEPASAPGFDADRAWAHLVAQVDIGPRPSGTSGAEENRRLIERELRAVGLEPRRETFVARPPSSVGIPSVSMANVVVDLPGRAGEGGAAPPILTFGAHYDTKRKVPRDRFDGELVGANDGASGVAVLLEMARILAAGEPRTFTLRLLFLDGEEALRWQWADPDNRYGSREHVRRLKKSGELERTKAFVLLDMVADKRLQLQQELDSDPRILAIFFGAAERNGDRQHVWGPREAIRDDHLSFIEAGIPSVDLIDLHFPDSWNGYWHTPEDNLDHVCKESMKVVGDMVLTALPELERHLLK